MDKESEHLRKQGLLKRLTYSGQIQRLIVYLASGVPAAILIFLGIIAYLGVINPVYIDNIVLGVWYDFIIFGVIVFTGVFGFYEFFRIRRKDAEDNRRYP